jgi:hypothetical protein
MEDRPDSLTELPEVENSPDAPFALLQAERKRLEEFAREQFALIRQARERFVAEKQAAEAVLETRRQELERQTQALLIRLGELHKKEEQLADQLENAIPERHGDVVPLETDRQMDPSADEKAFQELVSLRQQIREQAERLEQLQAERDTALEEVRQLHQAAAPAIAVEEDLPDQWAVALVEESAEKREVDSLRQQLQDQQARLEQFRAERDAAFAQLRRLPPPPEEVIQQEAEFVVLRRQLEQERRRLEEFARDVHLAEVEHQRRRDGAERELNEKRQQLERRAGELADRQLRLEEKAGEVRLHEAELREMKEIVERDTARERAELLLERLRIARLREALRIEQEALQAAAAREGLPVKDLQAQLHVAAERPAGP